jgi:hypothetical protein
MHDAFLNVLDVGDRGAEAKGEDAGIDRILAAAFFRTRPLQAGSCAHVVLLADRRSKTNRAR